MEHTCVLVYRFFVFLIHSLWYGKTLNFIHSTSPKRIIANCVCLIESEPEEFPINIDVSHFFIGVQLFWIENLFVEKKFLPA